MKKLLASLVIVLFLSTACMADNAAKLGDAIDAGICTGIAVAGYCQKTKTVYVNFVAIFFTVKACFHVLKATLGDNN